MLTFFFIHACMESRKRLHCLRPKLLLHVQTSKRLSNREEDVKQIQPFDDFFSAVRMSDGNERRAARIMQREKKRRRNAGAF